jgi:hypothetical protein
VSELPGWLQYIQALGPTIVAIVVGAIAAYIAYRQWLTAHYRLRFDVYEKRFAAYDATRSLISTITFHGQTTPEDLGNFYNGIKGAEFLFDGGTRDFMMKIGDLAFKARMARFALERSPNHPNQDRLIDQEEDFLELLRDQGQDQRLEKKFARYLDLSKLGL